MATKNETNGIESLIDEMNALVARIGEEQITDENGRTTLPPEYAAIAAIAVPGEPGELSLCKAIVRARLSMPAKPQSVTIPVSETGTYEMWNNEAVQESIETVLMATGKESLIATFRAKASYDDALKAWNEEASTVLGDLKRLVEILNRGIMALSGTSSTPRATSGRGRQNTKVRKGSAGVYHIDSPVPGDNYTNYAREEAWVVKNAGERLRNMGHNIDPEVLRARVYQIGESGEKVYVNA